MAGLQVRPHPVRELAGARPRGRRPTPAGALPSHPALPQLMAPVQRETLARATAVYLDRARTSSNAAGEGLVQQPSSCLSDASSAGEGAVRPQAFSGAGAARSHVRAGQHHATRALIPPCMWSQCVLQLGVQPAPG
jgi:hypothetical protein